MNGWRARVRERRLVVFAFALVVHAALLMLMSSAQMRRDPIDDGRTVQAIILPSSPARTSHPADAKPPAADTPHLRSLPRTFAEQRARVPQSLERQQTEQPAPQPASPPEAPFGTASAPLNLTLSRDQIKAMIAQDRPTLAQLAQHATNGLPYDKLAGDGDGMTLIELPHGVTEVHLHGECYRLVPTPRAQSDPFNHANERLSGPCIGAF